MSIEQELCGYETLEQAHAANRRAIAEAQRRVPGLGLSNANQAMRPLDEVAVAAERVEGAAARVEAFIHRFHGEGPACSGATDKALPPSGYSGQLNRLTRALAQLEEQVSALTSIG